VLEDYVEPQHNPFSIAGFIVSLVGVLILSSLCGAAAIILEGIAFYQYDQHQNHPYLMKKGKALMIAGFILGLFEFVVG